MPARMLRHRAVVQAARYTFGFGDIAEQDEVERWTSPERPTSKSPVAAPAIPPRHVPPPPPAPNPPSPPPPPAAIISADPGAKLARFEAALAEAETIADCDRAWIDIVEPMIKAGVLTREEQEEAEARMAECCGPLMERDNQNV